jgi:hypothetical protein
MIIKYMLSPEQLFKIDTLCDKLNGSQLFEYQRIQFWKTYFREKYELTYSAENTKTGGLNFFDNSHYLEGEEQNITWFLLNL